MRTTRSLSPVASQLPFSTTTRSVLEPGTACKPSGPHSVAGAPSSVRLSLRAVEAGFKQAVRERDEPYDG